MDDYSLVSLGDSKNEWCARLVNTLTPCVIEGLKSIFEEAWKLCVENDEEEKYLTNTNQKLVLLNPLQVIL